MFIIIIIIYFFRGEVTLKQLLNHFQKLKRSEREQNILLEQLRNYKLRNSPYNAPIKILSVVPHSTTCEKRQNLNITIIENMLKIHSYYLSNAERAKICWPKYFRRRIYKCKTKTLIG